MEDLLAFIAEDAVALSRLELGMQVRIKGLPNTKAVIKHIGPIHSAPGEYVGVELEKPLGKNDGTIDNVTYFLARGPKYGLFVRPLDVEVIQSAGLPNDGAPSYVSKKELLANGLKGSMWARSTQAQRLSAVGKDLSRTGGSPASASGRSLTGRRSVGTPDAGSMGGSPDALARAPEFDVSGTLQYGGSPAGSIDASALLLRLEESTSSPSSSSAGPSARAQVQVQGRAGQGSRGNSAAGKAQQADDDVQGDVTEQADSSTPAPNEAVRISVALAGRRPSNASTVSSHCAMPRQAQGPSKADKANAAAAALRAHRATPGGPTPRAVVQKSVAARRPGPGGSAPTGRASVGASARQGSGSGSAGTSGRSAAAGPQGVAAAGLEGSASVPAPAPPAAPVANNRAGLTYGSAPPSHRAQGSRGEAAKEGSSNKVGNRAGITYGPVKRAKEPSKGDESVPDTAADTPATGSSPGMGNGKPFLRAHSRGRMPGPAAGAGIGLQSPLGSPGAKTPGGVLRYRAISADRGLDASKAGGLYAGLAAQNSRLKPAMSPGGRGTAASLVDSSGLGAAEGFEGGRRGGVRGAQHSVAGALASEGGASRAGTGAVGWVSPKRSRGMLSPSPAKGGAAATPAHSLRRGFDTPHGLPFPADEPSSLQGAPDMIISPTRATPAAARRHTRTPGPASALISRASAASSAFDVLDGAHMAAVTPGLANGYIGLTGGGRGGGYGEGMPLPDHHADEDVVLSLVRSRVMGAHSSKKPGARPTSAAPSVGRRPTAATPGGTRTSSSASAALAPAPVSPTSIGAGSKRAVSPSAKPALPKEETYMAAMLRAKALAAQGSLSPKSAAAATRVAPVTPTSTSGAPVHSAEHASKGAAAGSGSSGPTMSAAQFMALRGGRTAPDSSASAQTAQSSFATIHQNNNNSGSGSGSNREPYGAMPLARRILDDVLQAQIDRANNKHSAGGAAGKAAPAISSAPLPPTTAASAPVFSLPPSTSTTPHSSPGGKGQGSARTQTPEEMALRALAATVLSPQRPMQQPKTSSGAPPSLPAAPPAVPGGTTAAAGGGAAGAQASAGSAQASGTGAGSEILARLRARYGGASLLEGLTAKALGLPVPNAGAGSGGSGGAGGGPGNDTASGAGSAEHGKLPGAAAQLRHHVYAPDTGSVSVMTTHGQAMPMPVPTHMPVRMPGSGAISPVDASPAHSSAGYIGTNAGQGKGAAVTSARGTGASTPSAQSVHGSEAMAPLDAAPPSAPPSAPVSRPGSSFAIDQASAAGAGAGAGAGAQVSAFAPPAGPVMPGDAGSGKAPGRKPPPPPAGIPSIPAALGTQQGTGSFKGAVQAVANKDVTDSTASGGKPPSRPPTPAGPGQPAVPTSSVVAPPPAPSATVTNAPVAVAAPIPAPAPVPPPTIASPGRTGRIAAMVRSYAGVCERGFNSGNPDKPCQDAIAMVEHAESDGLLLAVFDGHGEDGHFVAEFFRDRVPAAVFSHPAYSSYVDVADNIEQPAPQEEMRKIADAGPLASPVTKTSVKPATSAPIKRKDVGRALKSVLSAVEKELLARDDIDCSLSGCTGCVVVVNGDDVTVANVGDSRAALFRRVKGQVGADGIVEPDRLLPLPLTIDHKPTLPSETRRILLAGGRVHAITYDDGIDGPVRVWLRNEDVPGLAMSRSLGDTIGKKAGVSSEPDIYRYTLSPAADVFLLLASDGLWEFTPQADIALIIAETKAKADVESAAYYAAVAAREAAIDSCLPPEEWPDMPEEPPAQHLAIALDALAEEAGERWQKREGVIDDISIILAEVGMVHQ